MRTRLLKPLLAGMLLGLLLHYVGSYYWLSRRGMEEARACNMCGFLYVPMEEVLQTQDLSRHHRRAMLYAPLNHVDQKLFGAQGPVRCILWGLSR